MSEQTIENAPAPGVELSWAAVEIMGHRRLVGKVSEASIAGKAFLRVDVLGPPTPEGKDTFLTQYYPPESLFSFTPCTEEAARKEASYAWPRPASRLELPPPRYEDDDYDGGDYDDPDDDGDFR